MLTVIMSQLDAMVANINTVDGERFAGLNIRGFSAIKVFAEIFSRCLGLKCLLKGALISWCLFHYELRESR